MINHRVTVLLPLFGNNNDYENTVVIIISKSFMQKKVNYNWNNKEFVVSINQEAEIDLEG